MVGGGASGPASFTPPLELPPELELLVPLDPEEDPSPLLPFDPLEPLEEGAADEPSSSSVGGSVPDWELPGGPNSSVLLEPLHATTARSRDEEAKRTWSFMDEESRGESPT